MNILYVKAEPEKFSEGFNMIQAVSCKGIGNTFIPWVAITVPIGVTMCNGRSIMRLLREGGSGSPLPCQVFDPKKIDDVEQRRRIGRRGGMRRREGGVGKATPEDKMCRNIDRKSPSEIPEGPFNRI
jgi:hypothetical protein